MTGAATVGAGDRLRLFLALELPDETTRVLARWAKRELTSGRVVAMFHVTLAFLGSQPRSALDPVVDVLRREAAATEPFALGVARYRETRSVGMLVLDDPSGRAGALAGRVQTGLEGLGVYQRERRAWLPHVTVLRFRERPRLAPPLPRTGTFVPSGAAAFLSRLHRAGARYEVLESCPLSHGSKPLKRG
jgi:2'-5' RNA ligase